ncbi:MAG: ATP-binding cassette domain-containing protein, partial [Epsilonproteobacteria bacterium]|nr:ATP-binding cassette domain-containing protein [Campylobacterota bacterium]
LKELKVALTRYHELLKTLETDFQNASLLKEQSELVSYLELHDAWNLDEKIERVLEVFDLKQFEQSDVTMLSGGEQRRVTLAGLILQKPDILLLDEPTNHLDVYMVEFLEQMILNGKFTLLFISHDRYFIDRIATRTIEIEEASLRSFDGGYERYLTCKEQLILSLQKQHENLLKYLKGEEEWLRRGVKARLKRNEGRKQRVFELRDQAKKNPSLVRKLKLELEREKHNFNGDKILNKQKMLFEMESIAKTLGDKPLIKAFSARILQKDRIAIVGKNGAGKSTLLKILLGDLAIDQGKEVFAVPGSIDSPTSQGTNELLKQGVRVLTQIEDITSLPCCPACKSPTPSQQEHLDPVEKSVIEQLQENDLDFSSLCEKLQIPSSELMKTLTMLEIRGVIRKDKNVYSLYRSGLF